MEHRLHPSFSAKWIAGSNFQHRSQARYAQLLQAALARGWGSDREIAVRAAAGSQPQYSGDLRVLAGCRPTESFAFHRGLTCINRQAGAARLFRDADGRSLPTRWRTRIFVPKARSINWGSAVSAARGCVFSISAGCWPSADGGKAAKARCVCCCMQPTLIILSRIWALQWSKGCIRIPATLNTFIDRYGLLDEDYEQALEDGKKFWVLRADRRPTPWSGRYLVIVDSGSTERPAWSPEPSAAIRQPTANKRQEPIR